MLEQLSSSEQKLVSLAEELSSRDLETIHKEMADEEVQEFLHCEKINDFITAISFSSVIQLREVWLATSRWIYPRVLQNQHSMVSIAQCVQL